MTLLGTHTARMILATGTPYNNKINDLAALCAYYNVRKAHKQNNVKWWERAFAIKNGPEGQGALARLKRELSEWRASPRTGGEPLQPASHTPPSPACAHTLVLTVY
jgi:hypothetical protein